MRGTLWPVFLVAAFGAGCGSTSTAPVAGPVERPERAADLVPTTSRLAAIDAAPSDATLDAKAPASAVAPTPEAPPLPLGTKVLHVGDSFVHSGLTQGLRPKLEALGVHYEVRAEKSTNSLDWAKRVPELVAAIKPDLVIVTLGGNEIGSEHLDVQARAVGRIVAAIGDRPCIWTTPPLWREEEGVFDTIAANLGHCRFFETDVIVGKFIPRRPDNIHPTPEGGAMWADALYDWMMKERIGSPTPWSFTLPPSDEQTPKGKRNALAH